MEKHRSNPWRDIGLGAVVVGVILVVLGLATGSGSASSVEPITGFEGNPTCGDLAEEYGGGQEWTEIKFDPPVDGTMGPVTVDFHDDNTFDFTSTEGIDSVFVKAGRDKHALYLYDPPGPESLGDTGLTAASGKGNGISHVSFCWDGTPTTTTTVPSTTTGPSTTTTVPSTTTGPSTTTTVPSTTTTVPSTTTGPSTTTTVPSTTTGLSTTTTVPSTTGQVTTTTEPASVLGGGATNLPKTGSDIDWLVIVGGSLIVAGLASVSYGRKVVAG